MADGISTTIAANSNDNYHSDWKIFEPNAISPKPVMVVRPDGYTYVTLNEVQRFKCGLGRQAVQGMGIPITNHSGYHSDAEVVNVHSEASRTERRKGNSATHRTWMVAQQSWQKVLDQEQWNDANFNYHDARLATAHAMGSSDDEQ